MKDIKNGFEARELNYDIIYVAAMVNDVEALKEKFPPTYVNEFYHHSTIEFKPVKTQTLLDNVGKSVNLKVTHRLITEKVDVLIVENPGSTNKYPHITLSTAAGVKPFESNSEIEGALESDKRKNVKIKELTTHFQNFQKKYQVFIPSTVGLAVNLKS